MRIEVEPHPLQAAFTKALKKKSTNKANISLRSNALLMIGTSLRHPTQAGGRRVEAHWNAKTGSAQSRARPHGFRVTRLHAEKSFRLGCVICLVRSIAASRARDQYSITGRQKPDSSRRFVVGRSRHHQHRCLTEFD